MILGRGRAGNRDLSRPWLISTSLTQNQSIFSSIIIRPTWLKLSFPEDYEETIKNEGGHFISRQFNQQETSEDIPNLLGL